MSGIMASSCSGAATHEASESGIRDRGFLSGWSGAYYVQAPKIGSLFRHGSKCPFEDYPVSGRWIFQLVQMQKITFSAARAELVKTGENLCRVLPDLDRPCRVHSRPPAQAGNRRARIAAVHCLPKCLCT